MNNSEGVECKALSSVYDIIHPEAVNGKMKLFGFKRAPMEITSLAAY